MRGFVWNALANAVGTIAAAAILSAAGLLSAATLLAVLAAVWSPASQIADATVAALSTRSIPNWIAGLLVVGLGGMVIAIFRDRMQYVRVSIDDAVYSGPHPYADPHPASNVIYQVAITNKTQSPITIVSIKLHVDGREPLASAEQRESDHGIYRSQYLVPRGGGFSSIPSKESWWRPPHKLDRGESSVGWIGFNFGEPPDRLLFRDARNLKASLIVTPSSGRVVRAKALPCTMPDLGSSWQRRLYALDEQIEDLQAKALAAEEKMTGRGGAADEEAQSDFSFYTGLADEKRAERAQLAANPN